MNGKLIDKVMPWQRRIILAVIDACVITITLFGAFFLHESNSVFILMTQPLVLGVIVALRVAAYKLVGLYTFLWRYASTREFISIVRGSVLGSLLIVLYLFFNSLEIPRNVLIIELGFNILSVGATRVVLRLYRDYIRNNALNDLSDKVPVVIIGAGAAGNQILREILNSKQSPYRVVGVIDDKTNLKMQRIHNVPVLGRIEDIQALVSIHQFKEALIAMPSVKSKRIREIMSFCHESGIATKILPGLSAILGGNVSVSQFREVRIEDLLGRDVVALDTNAIASYLSGEVVMVTGAGGSIGSELCRQILNYSPKVLLLVDHSEFSIYSIEMELSRRKITTIIVPLVLSVVNMSRLTRVFEQYRPTIVFHAAAHKHVPLMESNIEALVENNIKGTQNVMILSDQFNIKNMVLISTDKAVNPTNCMGASKRVCEIMLQAYAQNSKTKFSAVRFGNVLGSQGSVIPLFKSQIAKGGPVTVTHEDMTRYFMTIPEAAGLVIQTGALSHGGEIFILDMGEPVKIIELARDLIRLSGLEVGDDVDIEITGLRPGEKMFEELFYDKSALKKTPHQKIFVTEPYTFNKTVVLSAIQSLFDVQKSEEIRDQLFSLAKYRVSGVNEIYQ